MKYTIDCTTCHWNFNVDEKNLCANVHYGKDVNEILLDNNLTCNDWKISFDLFCKLRKK